MALTVVGFIAPFVLGAFAWMIKRELNKLEKEKSEIRSDIRKANAERLEIRQQSEDVFRETALRVQQFERDVERDYVNRQDLQRELAPLTVSLNEILRDTKEHAIIPQILKQQGEQMSSALAEIKALREDSAMFWKEYSGPLAWAKRKSEE